MYEITQIIPSLPKAAVNDHILKSKDLSLVLTFRSLQLIFFNKIET